METRKIDAPVTVTTIFYMPFEPFKELKFCQRMLETPVIYSRDVCREFK